MIKFWQVSVRVEYENTTSPKMVPVFTPRNPIYINKAMVISVVPYATDNRYSVIGFIGTSEDYAVVEGYAEDVAAKLNGGSVA